MTTKVGTSSDRTMGHDGSGNIRLNEHTVRQCGVGGLVLLRGQGVQDGSIHSQRAHRGFFGAACGGRGSRVNTSGGVRILVALGVDT